MARECCEAMGLTFNLLLIPKATIRFENTSSRLLFRSDSHHVTANRLLNAAFARAALVNRTRQSKPTNRTVNRLLEEL